MYRYCGKDWSESDVRRIRELIGASPLALRAELARLVCAAFEWRRPNGKYKLMSCRVAMIRMWRDGLIELPPARNAVRRPRQTFVSPASDPEPEVEISIKDLKDLRVDVCQKKELRLWNEFIGRYHYLGYRIMPGAQIRYLIKAGESVLGAMGFGGPAWKVAPRDNFIGWTPDERQIGLHFIVNQTRFLILPWVRCKNLATKSLAMARARIAEDWEQRYGYRPVLLETFVDTTRFRGTCYKADNWIQVGLTQGRSRMDRAHKNAEPVKSIWLLPLSPDFRKRLLGERVE
jgi:hypothetical protein